MTTIAGFGDSFIYGTEIPGNADGLSGSWPALISKKLNCHYVCNARAGVGNEQIAQQIYSYINKNSVKDTVFVINWTWIGRWDVHLSVADKWITLGPSCVPLNLQRQLKNFLTADESDQLLHQFQQNLNSLLGHKFRNLQAIYAVHSLLKRLGAATIITSMDSELFNREWHVPEYIKVLQNEIEPDLLTFEGKNFLDWSRDRGFEITDAWHPLEPAHKAAGELWLEHYKKVVAQLESNN